MGLFGNLDAREVPDNPFYVAPDKYQCVLTEANVVAKKDGSGNGLSFKWVIEDEDSEFYQNSVSEWFDIFEDDVEVTADVKKKFARLKQRLLQMNVPPEKMDDLLENLDDLIGLVAFVEVRESTDSKDPDKKYSNVYKVTVLEDA